MKKGAKFGHLKVTHFSEIGHSQASFHETHIKFVLIDQQVEINDFSLRT